MHDEVNKQGKNTTEVVNAATRHSKRNEKNQIKNKAGIEDSSLRITHILLKTEN